MEFKKPFKLILAEDDKEDQELFKEALSRSNVPAELITVANGRQLLDALHLTNLHPDVIFIDINMPIMNGCECLIEIKRDEGLRDIPCIVLSSSDSENDIRNSYNAGANLYITKPTHFMELISIIKEVMMINWKDFKLDSYVKEKEKHFQI